MTEAYLTALLAAIPLLRTRRDQFHVRQYRRNHREHRRKYNLRWCHDNPEKVEKYNERKRADPRQREMARIRRDRLKAGPDYLRNGRERTARYYAENRTKVLAANRPIARLKLARLKETDPEGYLKHLEQRRVVVNRSNARLRQRDPEGFRRRKRLSCDRWRQNHSEEAKAKSQASKATARRELRDAYCRTILGLNKTECPPSLIRLHRATLTVRRALGLYERKQRTKPTENRTVDTQH